MPFFAPWMLLALGFAAVPILLHLFRKKSARKVKWAAWMFLAESLRQRRRRLMLEEIVLLVTRTLILALAAFAFARPFLPEMSLFGSHGMSRDVVLVMDTSASMGLCRPDGKTSLAASIEEARELVKLAPKDTAFALIDAGSDATGAKPHILTASLFTDKDEVYAALDKLQVGSGTMDAPEALAAAAEILAGGNNPAKEVVIFGDGQGNGWKPEDEASWLAIEQLFSRFKMRPAVIWRTPERPTHVVNAAIESVTPSRRIIGTDRPVRFAASVLNAGAEAVNPGELTFFVDGQPIARRSVGQIQPGLAKTLEFSYHFLTNGAHTVVTQLARPDDILADNCVTNPVNVLDTLDVVLVNGHPEQDGFDRPTAYLEAALEGGIVPRTVRGTALSDLKTLEKADVVALCDVPQLPPEAATNLANFVATGGGLLVVPADRAKSDFYRNWKRKKESVFAAVWTNFNGKALFDEAALATNRTDVTRRFADGGAAFVRMGFGKGRVGIWAEPLDPAWSPLPARPEFVPLVHELVYELVATNSMTALVDTKRRAQEGDLTALTSAQVDAIGAHIDLSFARLADDVLSGVIGKSFGVEIWKPFAIAVLLLMIFELVFARYVDALRRGEHLQAMPNRGEWRQPMGYLRAAAFLAILWMLSHYCLSHDVTRTIHRRVAVLTDASLSMRRYDLDSFGETNRIARYDIATNVANKLVANLEKRYDVETLTFGAGTTDFAAALEDVLAKIRPEELAGAVFVTDGRLTGGATPEAAARRFARAGAHVSTVLVGNPTSRCDVAVETVRAPTTVFLGDKVRLVATLRADHLAKKKVTVKFFDGEKELEKRDFETGDSVCWTKEVRFQHEPDAKGVRRYRITVETDGEDIELANNAWPSDVVVSDDRTNVLLIDRRPRWEFRYLRNLFFARDKSVNLQYVLTEPDTLAGAALNKPAASATRAFGDAEAGTLPANRDEWRRFDVIVLGDISPEMLKPEVAEDLRFCVAERGACVVFIAGETFMPKTFAASPVSGLFPVAVTNDSGAITAKWEPGAFSLALSPSGASHELMRLSDSESENRDLWDGFPPWTARLTGLTVLPGAEILAYVGESTALADPLVVVRHLGRGKTVFMASDETWRLRYRKGDTYHHRFWGNLLRWGAGMKLASGNAFARVGTEYLHYLPSEAVRLVARFTGRDAMPLEGLDPVAHIAQPDGRVREMPMTACEDANGFYEALLEPNEVEGRFAVTVTCPKAESALGADMPKPLETHFFVEKSYQPIEFAHLSADGAVPASMARLSSGKVVTPEKQDELNESFGEGRGEVVEHVEEPLWSHPIVLLILALALIAVWMLRKGRSLA